MQLRKMFLAAALATLIAGCGNDGEADKFNGTWNGKNPNGYNISYIIQHREGDNFVVEINTGMFKGSSFKAVMVDDDTLQHESQPSSEFQYNESDDTLYWTGKKTTLHKAGDGDSSDENATADISTDESANANADDSEASEGFAGSWKGSNRLGSTTAYIITHEEDDHYIAEVSTGMMKGQSFKAVATDDNTLQREDDPDLTFKYNEEDDTLLWTPEGAVMHRVES